MPINRRFNLATLIDACAYYCEKKRQRITFEYILIENVNDGLDQAVELARLARKLEAKINLIPYNTVQGLSWKRPSQRGSRLFTALRKAEWMPPFRLEKGHDIDAACGQLRLQTMRDKTFAGSPNLR